MRGPFKFRNYRLYFSGQAISHIGTWIQHVAQAWLVYTLSDSGTILGLAVAAQTLPVLLLGPWGGLLADRMNKRRLLIMTQSCLAVVAATTALLITLDLIQLWMVFVAALITGVVSATANPARQSFLSEMVDRESLRSAVSLNSIIVNSARAIGPAVAGLLIATLGLDICFYIDAFTYVFVIAALALMNTNELTTPLPAQRARGQIREGLRYVRNTPEILVPLLMMALIGIFAYEFQVLLPLVAAQTFNGQSDELGVLMSAQGAGSIVGGFYVARHGRTGIAATTKGAAMFGIAMALAAIAPTFAIAVALLFIVGVASVQFLSVGNTTMQLAAAPAFRGRVMALWTMAFLGSTPIGGPIVGWISEQLSPRLGLGIGALACGAAVLIGLWALRESTNSEHRASNTYTVEAVRA